MGKQEKETACSACKQYMYELCSLNWSMSKAVSKITCTEPLCASFVHSSIFHVWWNACIPSWKFLTR